MGMKEAMKAVMDAMPSRQEGGQELADRGQEAKSFLGNMMVEVGQELGRMGVQGQAELAGALFNGNAYVPYGEGQKAQEAPEHGLPEVSKEREMEMER